jgi:catechol 2,3-dioxygenase-like lactoylglutathione lyase family enzyme
MTPHQARTAEGPARGSTAGDPPPQVRGVLETALSVEDLRRSAEFYRRLFGFPAPLESDRLVALDVAGESVLLLFKVGSTTKPFPTSGGIVPGHWGDGRTHFAFAVTAQDPPAWRRRFSGEQVPTESEVTWPGGAVSIYFRDPDGNLAELITERFWRTY